MQTMNHILLFVCYWFYDTAEDLDQCGGSPGVTAPESDLRNWFWMLVWKLYVWSLELVQRTVAAIVPNQTSV